MWGSIKCDINIFLKNKSSIIPEVTISLLYNTNFKDNNKVL